MFPKSRRVLLGYLLGEVGQSAHEGDWIPFGGCLDPRPEGEIPPIRGKNAVWIVSGVDGMFIIGGKGLVISYRRMSRLVLLWPKHKRKWSVWGGSPASLMDLLATP